jgi:putative transposase
LSEAPVHAQQHALKDLENAYRRFFDKVSRFPQFKRKGEKESFRIPDRKAFRLEEVNSRILFPKLGWMRYRASRKIEGTLRNLTVSLRGEKWFVSVQTEREVELPVPPKGEAIGVDLGIIKFAALSTGEFLEGPQAFRKARKRLTAAQRALSRKKKFSNNWKKQKAKISRIHARVSNI